MFMRFRGGGVGHMGTRYLDSKLKDDNHDLDGERQEAGSGAEEDLGTHEELTSQREPGNEEEDDEEEEEDDDEDELEDEDEAEDEGTEHEDLRNTDNEQDLDDEDDGILDGEGFAELWDSEQKRCSYSTVNVFRIKSIYDYSPFGLRARTGRACMGYQENDWQAINQVDMIYSTQNRCTMIINAILELAMINPDHN